MKLWISTISGYPPLSGKNVTFGNFGFKKYILTTFVNSYKSGNSATSLSEKRCHTNVFKREGGPSKRNRYLKRDA